MVDDFSIYPSSSIQVEDLLSDYYLGGYGPLAFVKTGDDKYDLPATWEAQKALHPTEEHRKINTELKIQPNEGFFRYKFNEPGILAARRAAVDMDEPIYDVSDISSDEHGAVTQYGEYNPDLNQVGISDDWLGGKENKKSTAWHELLHWYERNYGIPAYLDQSRYREGLNSLYNKFQRGVDVHHVIQGLQQGTMPAHKQKWESDRSYTKAQAGEIMNAYNAAKRINESENYKVMTGTDRLPFKASDVSHGGESMPIRPDFDYSPSYTTPDRGDWGPGLHLARGGIASLRQNAG